MNWKNIELYDLPPCTDVLLMIEDSQGKVTYIVGDMDCNGYISTHTSWCGEYDGMTCTVSDYKKRGIKSIHFIDPNEILL